jgi:predicted Zn-dependent peptidase
MKIKQKKLINGATLITVPMKDTPTSTVLVMVEAGSKYETKEINGISHFLEHMCFKGTTKRPRSIDINQELDGIGAQNNAFTSFEYTGYYAKAHAKHTKKLIDVISDLYLNPTFPEKELQKEKGVIIEEMNMYEDMPQRKVWDVFIKLLYGDQPMGRTILGTKDVIKGSTREDFVEYRKKHYVASATTIVVAGNINEKVVQTLVAKSFAPISKEKKAKKLAVIEKQNKPAISIHHKDTDQAHLVLGVRTFCATDKRIPTLQVLNAVLGEGMSSRLFQRLREEMGVGYYVRSGSDDYTDHGYLAVSTGVDRARVKEVVVAILDEFDRLKKELVSLEELEKAKECIIGRLSMGLESSDAVAEFVGAQYLVTKKVQLPKDIEKKIRKITSKDVQKLAQEILVSRSLNLAIVGDKKDEKSIASILKI